MASNSRQTRTGAAPVGATIVEAPNASLPKTFMDKWVEPPLRPPQPSFKDYPHLSIERHGVLENMAALGTMPSSKLKKAAKPEPVRQPVVVKKQESSEATPTPRDVSTPEPGSRRRSDSRKAEDAEWNPKTPQAQMSGQKNGSRMSVGKQSVAPTTPSLSVSPSKEDTRFHKTKTDKVIEAACEDALVAGHYPTAFALRTLYNDHRSNPRIVRLIEAIYHQTADEAETAEFRSLMRYKKREGAKDGKANQYFEDNDNVYTSDLFKSSWNFPSPSSKRVASETANYSRSPVKESGHVSKKHKSRHSHHRRNTSELNGNGKMENGNRMRSRSKSVSSTSSLSSLDEDLLRDNFASSARKANQRDQDQARANSAEILADNQAQPITQQRLFGPKLHSFPTAIPNPPSSSTQNNVNNNMPIYLDEPFNDQSTQSQSLHQPGIKSHKKTTSGIVKRLPDDDSATRLKRRARDITENNAQVHDSYVRLPPRRSDPESESEGGPVIAAASQPPRQILRFRSRKLNDESDDLSSPTRLSFQPDAAPGSSFNSRAGTPNVVNRPLRKTKSGGVRMKTSPVKKGAGTSAGIPRASGERNSPVGNGGGLGHNQDDNDDYCSSCGGNGDLVCCDGCTRSFHLRCVDPPMSDDQLPDEWFCNICASLRYPPMNRESGPFGLLSFNLEKKNPSAFHLPRDVREYFENVRTGAEGEYEEGIVSKPKNRAGYEETADYLKVKDAKGNFILCHHCNQGAASRPIIPCSFCSLHWHLDCLDPPLANPPHQSKPWRCPCHVDDLLSKVPGSLGPAHRYRRIKGASVIKPIISRGIRNNGYVDIDFDPSEDEDEGFFDQKEYGHIYKLPEEGVKLDFLSRIRTQRAATVDYIPATSYSDDSPSQRTYTDRDRHSVSEQQAALNLMQLALQSPEYGTPGDAQNLIDNLMAAAPPAVIELIASGSPIAAAPLSQMDRQALLAMRALIDHRLGTEAAAIEKESDTKSVESSKDLADEYVKSEDLDTVMSEP